MCGFAGATASWFLVASVDSYSHSTSAPVLATLLSSVLVAVQIENGNDQKAIIGESGKKMSDDPAFAVPPDTLVHLEEDASCDNKPQWQRFREVLHTIPDAFTEEADIKEYRVAVSNNFLKSIQGQGTMEELAKECTFGIITALYFLAYYAIKYTLGGVRAARDYVHYIDMYASALHPGLFQTYNHHGALWPINISDITRLQRDFLRHTGFSTDLNKFPNEKIGAYDFDTDEDFKVYVYDTDEVPELRTLLDGAFYCKYNPWAAPEVLIHQFLLQSKVLTLDPNEADFFFVPQYSACNMSPTPEGEFTKKESDDLFKKIIKRLPYFRRTNGRDHVFVFMDERGVHGPFPSWQRNIKESIFLMAETELNNLNPTITEPSYSFHKDILIPARLPLAMINQVYNISWDLTGWTFIGDFVGWNRPLHPSDDGSKSPREVLLSLAADPRLHIRQNVPFDEALLGSSRSSFCFIPRGQGSATHTRLFRVMFANCLPVMLNDRAEIPFSELLPVHEWTIKLPMKNINGDVLLNRLEEIRNNHNLFNRMVLAMRRDRCWYLYPPSKIDFDYDDLIKYKPDNVCPKWKSENAFLAIMKLLSRKKRVSKHTDDTFYYPRENGTVYVDKNYNVLF